jgi:hypothetical protein
MNYAKDRLDRRSRHPDGTDSLYQDFCHGLFRSVTASSSSSSSSSSFTINHELVGRTLRDVGWNRHAVYHYAQAWCENPSCLKAAGDYCQMAELAGFPEVGFLGLVVYRIHGQLLAAAPADHVHMTAASSSADVIRAGRDWLQRSEPDLGQHCGCGCSSCGDSLCYIPMTNLENVFQSLTEYGRTLLDRTTIPTVSEVLNIVVDKKSVSMEDTWKIPCMLQFWKDDDVKNFRKLPTVLQLLQVKLAYLTVPFLAADAVVHATFDERDYECNNGNGTSLTESQFVAEFKSHFAYYVFVKAVVLGERTKHHRRRLYLPVWEAMRNRLLECQQQETIACNSTGSETKDGILDSLVTNLRQLCLSNSNSKPRHVDDALPPLLWSFSQPKNTSIKPLYYLGDSHVLSLAWQTVRLPPCVSSSSSSSVQHRLVVPVLTTGLKAWHVQSTTRFFTHSNLRTAVCRTYSSSCGTTTSTATTATWTIVVSAGEIDCREGIGGALLQGYTVTCHEHIQPTVLQYVRALQTLAVEYHCQILVVPVAPHARRKQKGRVAGQVLRRETVRAWNAELRAALPLQELVFFLDYETALVDDMPGQHDYVLKPAFNADGTHMNAAFAPEFENAIASCGCNMSLL